MLAHVARICFLLFLTNLTNAVRNISGRRSHIKFYKLQNFLKIFINFLIEFCMLLCIGEKFTTLVPPESSGIYKTTIMYSNDSFKFYIIVKTHNLWWLNYILIAPDTSITRNDVWDFFSIYMTSTIDFLMNGWMDRF